MSSSPSNSSIRIPIALAALVGLAVGGWFVAKYRSGAPVSQEAQAPAQDTDILTVHDGENGATEQPPAGEPTVISQLPPVQSATATGTVAVSPSPVAQPEPSAYTRELVQHLSRFGQPAGALTPEQLAQWKLNFQQLVQQGAAGLPAIQEFLKKNIDIDFGADGKASLGYDSARAAMFDALRQIGGPEATTAMLDVLQSTGEPREIAMLARHLDQMAPEEHRQAALDAARRALDLAGAGKLQGADVAPLFELLQNFGGTSAIAELENSAKQWKYYATIALAQLPDGAGIPSLTRMAENPASGSRDAALQMLAQMSVTHPDARSFLFEQVRQNKIPSNVWPYIVSALSGGPFQFRDAVFGPDIASVDRRNLRTTRLNFSNQNFYRSTTGLTPDFVGQQISVIDQLLSLTRDSVALDQLQRERKTLAASLAQSQTSPNSAQ